MYCSIVAPKIAPSSLLKFLRGIAMTNKSRQSIASEPVALTPLRFEVIEAARILRMSRAQLYNRMQEGSIRPQKDGARTYFTRDELERYVKCCGTAAPL